MKKFNKYDDIEKIASIKSENKIHCKCGSRIFMGENEKMICNWCGNWIFKNKKAEFDFRVKEKLNEVARDNKNSL